MKSWSHCSGAVTRSSRNTGACDARVHKGQGSGTGGQLSFWDLRCRVSLALIPGCLEPRYFFKSDSNEYLAIATFYNSEQILINSVCANLLTTYTCGLLQYNNIFIRQNIKVPLSVLYVPSSLILYRLLAYFWKLLAWSLISASLLSSYPPKYQQSPHKQTWQYSRFSLPYISKLFHILWKNHF